MAFRNDFIEQLNKKLLNGGMSINMPEHKFKKSPELFNNILREVHEENKEKDIEMYHILLSLSEYFEMDWLKDNVLDKRNLETVERELEKEYSVSKYKKKKNA